MIKKIYTLLNSIEKKQLLFLLIIMIIGALLDTMGVAVFFPFIALLKDPNIINNYPVPLTYLNDIGINGEAQIMIFFAISLIVFFIFKNLFITYMNYKQFNFTYKSQVNLAKRLYEKYIFNDYEFHINTNTSVLYRNLKENSFWIFSSILYPMIIIATEIFVILFLLTVLMLVSPKVTTYVIVGFLTIGYLFYNSIKSKSKYYGELQQQSVKDMNKWINQGLYGIQDIKLHQNEAYFFKKFSKYSDRYAYNNVFQKTIDSIPKQLLETLLMVGIAIAVIFIVKSGNNFMDLLPTITLFAFSAIRLMPSANRIMSALGNIKFYSSALDNIYEEFNNKTTENNFQRTDEQTQDKIVFSKGIELHDIDYYYPNSNHKALNNLSLSINKGQFIGIAGPSGCGKSTLVNIMTGLLKPTSGAIKVDSIHIKQDTIQSWRQIIGYIPQSAYLLDDTIKNNIAFGLNPEEIDEDKIINVLESANLIQYIESLEKGIDTSIGEHGIKLSGGQKQRLGIARALYFDAEILIFDETTSALDTITEERIMNTIKQLKNNKTIIVIAHRLSTIKTADKIFFMENGSISNTGTFDSIYHSNAAFKQMVEKSYK